MDRCHSSRVKGAVARVTPNRGDEGRCEAGELSSYRLCAGEQMACQAKAPARTEGERTPVREPRTTAGNAGMGRQVRSRGGV